MLDNRQANRPCYDANSPPSPQHATGYLSAHHQPVYLDMSEFGPAGALAFTAGIARSARIGSSASRRWMRRSRPQFPV
ncbi:MAG TPA: hypothetical protein VH393_03990 [Ktedonobacterales bacterium]